jgi:hypothetical protein
MANPIALNSLYLPKKIVLKLLICRILRENQSERRGEDIPSHEDKDKLTHGEKTMKPPILAKEQKITGLVKERDITRTS